MGLTPFAFSVHNFISSVGADAGFAAIIGLAILVLLYFAHARETANLREDAALLAARLQQAEARVAELSRPQPVAVPAPEAVQVTDRRGAGLGPFAPAGTAAPALASATHVVPLPSPAEPVAIDPAPALAMASASVASASVPSASPVAPSAGAGGPPGPTIAAPPPARRGPAAPAPSPVARLASPPRAPGSSDQLGPLPASSDSPGGPPPPSDQPGGPPASSDSLPRPPASSRSAIPGPATAAGANGGGQGSAPPVAVAPASARPPAAGTGARPPRQLPPLGPPASRDGSPARRIVIALGALLLLAAAAIALVSITSSGGSPSPRATARTTNAPTTKRVPVFTPSAVTVAVLNGTSTNQLAHHVAAKLASDGYKEGRIATAANQTLTTTIVAYLPGTKNRADALHVANALNLRSTAVRPIDQGTQQVACPPPGVCGANVVVTVGADLATL